MENIHIRMGSYMLTINPIFGITPYNQEGTTDSQLLPEE